MERTCQFSYPLNSEKASPPGTFTVYLSWADRALPPTALTSAVTIAIVPMPLLLITSSSSIAPWYQAASDAHADKPPNGLRLSCGRRARGRKEIERVRELPGSKEDTCHQAAL